MLIGIKINNDTTSSEAITQLVGIRELHISMINSNGEFQLKIELSESGLRKLYKKFARE